MTIIRVFFQYTIQGSFVAKALARDEEGNQDQIDLAIDKSMTVADFLKSLNITATKSTVEELILALRSIPAEPPY